MGNYSGKPQKQSILSITSVKKSVSVGWLDFQDVAARDLTEGAVAQVNYRVAAIFGSPNNRTNFPRLVYRSDCPGAFKNCAVCNQ
jgi:hypothetical protein